jgi:L-ascorbate metabolism protein UlaG (beta-lactamase superfamily)
MKLTYIYHSGFAVEDANFSLIFDFFRDTEDVFIRRHIATFPGRVYVFVSHWHPDHFNPDVMQWKDQRTDIRYIFSDDLLKRRSIDFSGVNFLAKGQVWNDDLLQVHAFGSTDTGGSFLVEAGGKRIFHAGDLNNWHWNEESTPEEAQACEDAFLEEIAFMAQAVDRVDVAMFPVDPRLGKDYMRGPEQFVDRIRTGLFVPMHFGSAYEKATAFRAYAERAGCRFAAWKQKGEQLEL